MSSLRTAFARRRARAASHVLAAAGLAMALAGCYQTPVAQPDYPTDYRQRHPISLREGSRTVEVFVGHNRGGLAPDQRADVLAFAQTWRRESMSGVAIEVPRDRSIDRAANESLHEIRSILAASGIPPKAIYVTAYQPLPSALTSIRLSYSKLVAEAGPCGQWPADLGPSLDGKDFENRPYWNLGCATQRNMAAMIENPADLVQPRGETPPYMERRSVAIDKYRLGTNPSGTYVGYDIGKITDIGK
ncbi:MAG TPA: CpaD family pilus assembly protein [Pseudolabrys sp.]|nr:CpaD family pilus assembly protein [Pseudolabrys sp.]